MSKHKSRKPVLPAQSVAYPSPQERERILQRRSDLQREILFALVAGPEAARYQRIDQLVQEHGREEVARTLDLVKKTSSRRELLTEESLLYRDYRQIFARYGGQRRFLNRPEHTNLTFENAMLLGRRTLLAAVPRLRSRSKRERELHNLLLLEANLWEDITPPAVPPRPADWASPAPGVYADPAQALLQWGWNLDDQRTADQARNTARWRPAIADLARMVLDGGLLEGWPGEAASWAPFHALNLLGYLRASECSRSLVALIDRQNDWLSDQLPQVWVHMGLAVEPVLWEYLDDLGRPARKRGVALAGLEALAQANAAQRAGIVAELAERLQAAAASEAEMNGLIVFVLNRMKATQAKSAIAEAFRRRKVDPKVMRRQDVDFL